MTPIITLTGLLVFQFDVAREVHLSYLPLSHIYERFVCHTCITAGAKIGFYQGDMSKVVDDMNELQPTLLIAVPKQLNRLYDKAWTEIRAKGGIAEFAFNSAYKSKLASLQKSGTLEHGMWEYTFPRDKCPS